MLSIDNEASYSENCSPGGLKVYGITLLMIRMKGHLAAYIRYEYDGIQSDEKISGENFWSRTRRNKNVEAVSQQI